MATVIDDVAVRGCSAGRFRTNSAAVVIRVPAANAPTQINGFTVAP